jgi:hypothetical protein
VRNGRGLAETGRKGRNGAVREGSLLLVLDHERKINTLAKATGSDEIKKILLQFSAFLQTDADRIPSAQQVSAGARRKARLQNSKLRRHVLPQTTINTASP